MPYLRYAESNGTTRFVSLQAVTVIGRSAECEMSIVDALASRRHAEVRRMGDAYILKDLQSKNGTLVNGQPVATFWTLRDGDLIAIGNAQILYRVQK